LAGISGVDITIDAAGNGTVDVSGTELSIAEGFVGSVIRTP
jgi:hypothetical protein